MIPQILKGFVTEIERTTLLTWILNLRATGQLQANEAGAGRFFKPYRDIADVIPEFFVVKDRIKEVIGATDDDEDPIVSWFVGCNEPGAFVHAHTDQALPGCIHIRGNVLLQAPDGEGGMPIIDDVEYPIESGDAWIFSPSGSTHKTVTIGGSLVRVVCSYGFQVKQ